MRTHDIRVHDRLLIFATTIGAAALLSAVGCGGSSTPVSLSNSVFIGTLGNGEVLTLNFGTEASGTIPLTGTLTKGGTTTINLTGTYTVSSYAISASGGGYTLTGSVANTTATGTYTGPSDSGSFAAFKGDTTSVTVYCGTYAGDASGSWNLVRNGNSVAGAYSHGKLTNGTVNGNNVSFSITDDSAGPGSGTGTISGSSVSGTWTVGSSTGNWTGSTSC